MNVLVPLIFDKQSYFLDKQYNKRNFVKNHRIIRQSGVINKQLYQIHYANYYLDTIMMGAKQ